MKSVKEESQGLNKIFKKLSPYIGLGILLLLTLSLLGSISRTKKIGLEINKEEEKINKLKKENEELQKDLEIASSEGFIEKQLRDKLGMAKEGEIVVILPDEEIVKKYAPRVDEEEEILPDPNWKKWMKLFL